MESSHVHWQASLKGAPHGGPALASLRTERVEGGGDTARNELVHALLLSRRCRARGRGEEPLLLDLWLWDSMVLGCGNRRRNNRVHGNVWSDEGRLSNPRVLGGRGREVVE